SVGCGLDWDGASPARRCRGDGGVVAVFVWPVLVEGVVMRQEEGHRDRVLWYRALIEEWTGQAPAATLMGEWAVAWVESYCSAAGVWHVPTECCAETVEQALEGLANAVYTALQ